MSLIGGLTWRRQFRDGQSAPFGLCPNLPMRSICSHAHSQFQTADVVLCCPANLGGFSAFIPRSVVFLFLKYPEQVLTRVRKKQIGGQEIGSTFQLLGHRIDRSRTAELLRQFANLSVGRVRPRSLWPFLSVSVRRLLENRIKIKHSVWDETST